MDSYHGKHSLSMIRYFFMSFWKITRRTSQESGNHVQASIFYILDTDVFCVNKTLVQFLRAGCREYFVYFQPKTSLFYALTGSYLLALVALSEAETLSDVSAHPYRRYLRLIGRSTLLYYFLYNLSEKSISKLVQ